MKIQDEELLRKQGVANMLGFSRHTLGRIIKKDPTFPVFFEISPGIKMIRASEIRRWLSMKELEAREKSMIAHIEQN